MMAITEDENGRIRATEETELMKLPIVEFFIKLGIFQERMKSKVDELNSLKRKK